MRYEFQNMSRLASRFTSSRAESNRAKCYMSRVELSFFLLKASWIEFGFFSISSPIHYEILNYSTYWFASQLDSLAALAEIELSYYHNSYIAEEVLVILFLLDFMVSSNSESVSMENFQLIIFIGENIIYWWNLQ